MEKTSFKWICICCLCLIWVSTTAQIVQDANGRPILAKKYVDVEGNPYLADDWLKGTVKLSGGENYQDIPLKYDLVSNELFFQNSKGEPMSFVNPVREFTIVSPNETGEKHALQFRNGYKAADGGTAETFYQVLTDGETPLIKKISKIVVETKPFNSATTTKSFERSDVYYLVKDGLPLKIRKDKKSILEFLHDYSAQLENYIKTNKLNLKSDSGLIALISYYNSLK
jgi:hypothetical protein